MERWNVDDGNADRSLGIMSCLSLLWPSPDRAWAWVTTYRPTYLPTDLPTYAFRLSWQTVLAHGIICAISYIVYHTYTAYRMSNMSCTRGMSCMHAEVPSMAGCHLWAQHDQVRNTYIHIHMRKHTQLKPATFELGSDDATGSNQVGQVGERLRL